MSKRFTLVVCLLPLVAAACGGSTSPTAPTASTPPPPQIPACQANHTAVIAFENRGKSTVNIHLDGANIGLLAPQASGLSRTVAAGVAHSVGIYLTNTSISLCATFNPIPVECSSTTYQSCLY